MNNYPLMLSILFGIIVILIIVGVSLSVQLSNESKKNVTYLSEKMELQKINQKLEEEMNSLTKNNSDLKKQIEQCKDKIISLEEEKRNLEGELEKITELKDTLEDHLIKSDLMEKRYKKVR